jgi:hypothetical protein
VKTAADYLEHADGFERMAAEATDPALKKALSKQAEAYRRLAEKHARDDGFPLSGTSPRLCR